MKLAQPVFVALAAASVLGAAKAFGGQSECAKDNTDLLLTIAANVEALTARVETLADGQKALADRVEGLEGGQNQLLSEVRWGYPAHTPDFAAVAALPLSSTILPLWWEGTASSASGVVLAAVSRNGPNPGDIWISEDAGASWTSQDQEMAWFDITCDDSGSKFAAVRLVPGTSSEYRIVTRVDAGPWVEVDPSLTGTSGVMWKSATMSGDGTVLYASTWTGGSNRGIWKAHFSEADGIWTNWSLAPSPEGFDWSDAGTLGNIGGIASSVDGKAVVACYIGGVVFTSSDFGNTWIPRGTDNGLLPSDKVTYEAVASSSDGEILAVAPVSAGAGNVRSGASYIRVSHDAGKTWVPRGPSKSWRAIVSSADGMKLAAAAQDTLEHGTGAIWTSTDSGLTWDKAPGTESQAWFSIAGSADGKTLVAGSMENGVWTSPPYPDLP